MSQIMFTPLASSVDSSFWSKLSWLKLNVWKLDSSVRRLRGFVRSALELSAESFEDEVKSSNSRSVSGQLILFESADAFKSFNKKDLLDRMGADLVSGWAGSGQVVDCAAFTVLCYPNIKEHSYLYWVAVPAIVALAELPAVGVRDIVTWRAAGVGVAGRQEVAHVAALCHATERRSVAYALLPSAPVSLDSDGVVTLITAAESPLQLVFFDDIGNTSLLAAASTASALEDQSALDSPICLNLGWLCRNALSVIALSSRRVTTLRALVLPASPTSCGHDTAVGVWLDISIGELHAAPLLDPASVAASPRQLPHGLAAVGWELNAKGQPGPRMAHLRHKMDSAALADASSDLNLSLMRWRMLPGLDLPRLAASKCLLLGAGTLGCHVARDLVAWGIRHITLVDSGDVSYSNPVRQPLYEFKDVGRPKAQVAAEALAAIRPGINATARVLSIPMPDHPLGGGPEGAAHVKATVAELRRLIVDHDVVFLMTDTRESRWLPTLLAAEAGRLAITVALGFDSYLVMRHGLQEPPAGLPPGCPPRPPALGCYFCGDVVGPLNSTLNRSLDQQCTVTRPACAPIASAMAVELFVSLLHHPRGGLAPADVGPLDLSSKTSTALGAVPHQIRGFLTHFAHLLMANPGFDRCTACSPAIVAAFREGGFPFLARTFNEGAPYLEAVTGLDLLQASTAALELEDVEDFDEEGGGESGTPP